MIPMRYIRAYFYSGFESFNDGFKKLGIFKILALHYWNVNALNPFINLMFCSFNSLFVNLASQVQQSASRCHFLSI